MVGTWLRYVALRCRRATGKNPIAAEAEDNRGLAGWWQALAASWKSECHEPSKQQCPTSNQTNNLDTQGYRTFDI